MSQAKKKEMHQTKVKLGNKGIECDCDSFTLISFVGKS